MKLVIAAAAIFGIVGLALFMASAQSPQAEAWSFFKTPTPKPATPTPTPPANIVNPANTPPECAGMTFQSLINQPTQDGIFNGTANADLIIVGSGQVDGKAGNDCIVFMSPIGANIAYGGLGNDVLITRYDPDSPEWEEPPAAVSGIAFGDAGTDRCIGLWEVLVSCEETN